MPAQTRSSRQREESQSLLSNRSRSPTPDFQEVEEGPSSQLILEEETPSGSCPGNQAIPEITYPEWFDDFNEDNMAETPSASTATIVKLRTWQDWNVWITYLQNEAENHNIWDDINPGTEELDPDNPVQLKKAPTYKKENNWTREQIQDAQFDYKVNREAWQEKQKGYQRIRTILDQSLSADLQHRVINCKTIREKLKKLLEYTRPNTLAATQLLKKELETLSLPPYGKTISNHMQLWFLWCGKRDSIGKQADNESTQAWLSSMSLLYGDYVATRTGKLLDKQGDREVTTLHSELRA